MNGVYETSSGDLLRAGFSDFENDGAFDAGTESYRTDVPSPALARREGAAGNMHRWNGSAWVEVAQPAGRSKTFQFFETNPIQTTTAQTMQTALTNTLPGLQAGVYRMSWYCEIRLDPAGAQDSRGNVEFDIDGAVKGSSSNGTNDWVSCGGWDKYNPADDEAPVLTIKFRRDAGVGGTGTIQIRKLKMGFEFMS